MPANRDETRTQDPNPPTGTHDPALDAGLAAAFGPDPTPGGWSLPPLLRDDPSEHAPLVQPASAEMPRGSESRYQLLGEIARGGMGVVLKGRDPDLGRDLAFKVLRSELVNKPAAEQRFVEEAQVGGQLQHPGVVPVYDLGRFADGRPYFAMKLVKGRTLADILAERESPAEDRGRFLQQFLQVCQTIAYAHAKGVIHRDLKPSNVMVGPFGEVLVMDWGLAKILPRGGVADELKATRNRQRSNGPVEEPTVIHTARAGSGGSETQAGSVMGTPAFMSPEQAGGEIDKLDERADVFGLGAVLCVILTGQPPFVADTAEAVRLMAVRGDLEDAFARLDSCGTDAELVNLCKQCLAPKRDTRPRHAGEVADAVAEYLAEVEGRAHRAEVERAAADARTIEEANTRREAEARVTAERQRRKVQAVLGSLVTLVVLVGGAAAAWQWQRAEREEKKTREALEQVTAEKEKTANALEQVTAEKEKTADALAKATEEQTRTFAALNAMTDEGVERLFQAQLEVGEEQKAFVRQVIALYDEATRSGLDAPEGRSRRADGHIRVGRLRTQIEDHAGAVESFKAALALLNPLCETFPDDRTHQFHRAKARSYLGRALSLRGRNSEAEAESRAAVGALQSLVEADRNNLDYQFELGNAQRTLGGTLAQLGRQQEAVAMTRSAIQSYRAVCERAPANTEYASPYLHAHSDLANLLPANSAEKEAAAREAVAVADPLRERHPKDAKIQFGYLRCHHNLVVALMGVNKLTAAEPEARLVRDGWLDLTKRYPTVSSYRSDLAYSYSNHALILSRLNRHQEAAAQDAAAVAVYQRLIAEAPTNRSSRLNCTFCLRRLGEYQYSLLTADALGEAERHYRAALKLIDEYLARNRTDREYFRLSIQTHEALGRVRSARGAYADGVAEYQTALTRLKPMMEAFPDDRQLLGLRAQARFNLGLALNAISQVPDARSSFRAALADYEALARQKEKDFGSRDALARCWHQLALIHMRETQFAEALAELRTEQDIRTRLGADSPTRANRAELGSSIQLAGICLRELGRHPEAEKEYLVALPIFRELVAEFPTNRAYQQGLAHTLQSLAHTLITLQRFAEVEKPAAEADRLHAELYKLSSDNRVLRTSYALNTGYLALARVHAGDHASARELLGKAVALDPNRVLTYLNAACILNHCVLAAKRDPRLTDQQQKDLVNEYTDRALGYLRRAVELAPDATPLERWEFDKFRTDKDLDVFRGHPEFKKILADYDKLPAPAPPPREVKR